MTKSPKQTVPETPNIHEQDLSHAVKGKILGRLAIKGHHTISNADREKGFYRDLARDHDVLIVDLNDGLDARYNVG